MINFLVKKLAYGCLVMMGVVLIVFLLFQGFGDPSRLVLGQRADAATQQNIRKELYLDQPKWKQLVLYVNDLSFVSWYDSSTLRNRANYLSLIVTSKSSIVLKFPYLRRSYQSKREVGTVLAEALPGTFLLALTAMFLACVIGIPLGVLAARYKGTWVDSSAVFTGIIGISAPSFFIGIIIAYLVGFLLFPYIGLPMNGSLHETDAFLGTHLQLKNLILPAITLGIRPMAIITQLTRSAMLDVLQQDFIRTAIAKGLSAQKVIWKHALKNALNPVITASTGWFAELLAGAFFVEYIFGWKGIGKVTVDALEKLDFPVVMGSVLVSALFFVLMNIVADLLNAWNDPRIRLG